MAQTRSFRFKKRDEPILPVAVSNPSKSSYKFRKKDEGTGAVIILSLLLILVILFGGALLFILSQKNNDQGQVQPIDNSTMSLANNTTIINLTTICTDNCIYSKAVNESNYSACFMILNSTIIQMCFEHFSNDSFDACKLLTDVEKKKGCVTKFAVAEGNALLCDLLLTEGNMDCRVQVDPCYAESDQDLCQALKSDDPSKCKSNDNCLLNYSITSSDSESCKLISDNVTSAACLFVTSDENKCADLTGPRMEYCYQLYSIFSGDYSYCSSITNLEGPYALDCYSNYAVSSGNHSVCDVLSLDQRWDCYSYYSIQTEDLDGCDDIHLLAETHRFQCVFNYAIKYGNPSACNILPDLTSRYTCFQGPILYSQQNLDWEYCDDISNSDWSNKCFNEAAKLNSDISLCNYIVEDYAKEACKYAYELNKTK